MRKDEQDIIAALTVYTTMTGRQLADVTEIPLNKVWQILGKLERAGLVASEVPRRHDEKHRTYKLIGKHPTVH